MILKLVLFVLIAVVIYELINKIYENKTLEKINKYISEKNEKYYTEFIRKYEKSKKVKLTDKLNINYKINLLIDKADIPRSVLINPITIIAVGLICVLVAYKLTFNFFKVILLSAIISIPCFFIPIIIINLIGTYKEEKMEKTFLNFLLQVKNYTKINNDITSAFKEVETIEPLQSYINRFNIELQSGIKFESAVEHLKEKMSTLKFKEFFANMQYCYLYGGNFSELIDKNYKMISDIQKEKLKREQETKGARLALFILIFLNIYVYIVYIKNNYENYLIMQKSAFGNIILYWNFISMWLLLWLSVKVKKLDY